MYQDSEILFSSLRTRWLVPDVRVFYRFLTRELTPRTVRVLCEKFCLMNCFYARVLAVIVFLLTC